MDPESITVAGDSDYLDVQRAWRSDYPPTIVKKVSDRSSLSSSF
ncbi:hypothetical protein ACFVSS_07655 [Peribacillus butanolivorans]